MYNYAIGTSVADRQRVFMQQADNHRPIGNAGPEPRVRRAHRLALRIWAVAQLPGIVRGRPSVVAPPSVVVGSPSVN